VRENWRTVGRVLAVGILAGMGGVRPGRAQESVVAGRSGDAARIAALEEKIRRLDERLALLESRPSENAGVLVASTGAIPAVAIVPATAAAALTAGAPAPSAPPQVATPEVLVGAGADGFNLRSADEDFQLNIRHQLNVDSRFAPDRTTGEPNSIYLRRAQIILGGTMFRRFEYYLLSDFGSGRARANDAYMEIAFAPGLSLQAGKFKMPVGLERLRGGTSLTIAERSLATQLVPNRDVGLQLYGDLGDGKISYAVGVFNGVADAVTGDGDTDDGKEFAARFFSHPFGGSGVNALEGLGLGIGMSRGQTQTLPEYSTTGQTTFFEYSSAAIADGTRYRIAPQAYYYSGRLGLLGEYVLSSQQIRNSLTNQFYSPKNSGFQVQGSFLLTDDTASYAAVTPARNFDPAHGTFGAFELAARYTELRVDRGVYEQGIGGGMAQKAKAWALGLNWYMNRSVRLMFNYEHTDFVERPGGDAVPTEKVFLQRLQFRL